MSGDVEVNNCSQCEAKNVPVRRTYYYYPIKCKCCNNPNDPHFEMVYTCGNCRPVPPKTLSVGIDPIDYENQKMLAPVSESHLTEDVPTDLRFVQRMMYKHKTPHDKSLVDKRILTIEVETFAPLPEHFKHDLFDLLCKTVK